MKVLLVDVVRTSLEEVWPSVEHSLGLMYIAAAARRELGGDVEIRIWTLVSKVGGEDEERATLRQTLEQFEPDAVGVRCLSIGKDSLALAAETVKSWSSSCLVLAGGPHATDAPEEVLLETLVDCVVIGEGERTFTEILEAVRSGRPLARIAGTAAREHGRIVRGPARTLIEDLDAIPRPDYSLVDLDAFTNRYLTFTSKIFQPHANILTTRGCPYRCMYCHNILGKAFRARSPQNVFDEIRWLHDELGMTDFQIVDDIFNLDIERAKAICDLVIQSDMKLTFSFPNGVRGDRMDEELIDKMAAMGTKFVSYAIESASPRIQRLIRKNLRLERVFDAIEYSTSVGIVTRGFFMLGFPTETLDEAKETVQFAVSSSLCGATFFTVVYFPGTDLYKLAQSLGYFRDGPAEVRRDYVQVADGPYEFETEQLAQLKRSAIIQFSFSEERVDRALRLLPGYFTQREIDGFFMAYVVSSRIAIEEIAAETVRDRLHRHFTVAQRFSRSRTEFFV